MELFTMNKEIIGSYQNKTKKEVKDFINDMPEYTYTYQFKELLEVTKHNGITMVTLNLEDDSKKPSSLYQIISITRELEQL